MSRIKTQILSKLKEYANKMGRDHLGGDDYTSKKRGGLRDFDGYDNVDYNKDMPMDEATKGDVMRAVKGNPNPYSLVVIKRGKVIYQKDIKNPQDVPAVYSVIRKHMDKGERIHIEDRTGKIVFKEGINEACWKGYKEVGGKIKNGKRVPNCVPESIEEGMMSTIDQIRKDSKNVRDFIKKVFLDSDFRDMKGDKDFIKYLGNIYEGIEENFPSNWMQGRTSDYHTKLRGKKREYDDTNFDKEHSGQPDLEEVHKVAGRPVKINKGKKKDGTDWTVTFKNGKTLPLSDVLALIKPFPKGIKEAGFDKIEHLKLLNKAMRAMPGSPKQKDIIRKLNVVRKAGGMRPLKEKSIVEYASRLTLSYIADKDSKLDGTPEDIKAIDEKAERDYKDEYKKFQSSKKSKKYRAELNKYNRQKGTYGNGDGKDASHKGGKIVGFEAQSKNRGRREKSRLKKESVINEVGVFPVTNYIKGIIPQGRLDTNTPEAKRKSAKLVGDLKKTLNTFWKQHDIPFKIK